MKVEEIVNAAHIAAESKPWLLREINKYPLHPALQIMIEGRNLLPVDLNQLAIEWPHKSSDGMRLAYTPSEAYGIADRQTVVTIGRYLTKHFPDVKSDQIRDVAALFSQNENNVCKFTPDDVMEYVNAVQNGPTSCMKWPRYTAGSDKHHPYEVYDPKFGWRMAVRIQDGRIWGRCLCHESSNKSSKTFVRSYTSNPEFYEASQSDTTLEAWLIEQGYIKTSAWRERIEMARIETPDYIVAPYLDGEIQHVSDYGDRLVVDSEGLYEMSNTDGSLDCEEKSYCDHCERYFSETYPVGPFSNDYVCQRCIDSEYSSVYGRNGDQYEILYRNAIRVGDEYYDPDYLADNDIVEITAGGCKGEYAHKNDVIEDAYGEIWDENDDDVVLVDAGTFQNEYMPVERTWVCFNSKLRYAHSDECVEVDGETYEPSTVQMSLLSSASENDASVTDHA